MATKGPKKISELPTANTFAETDRLVILTNPDTTPVIKTIEATVLLGGADASANGYSYLPSGIIIQWGTVSANSSAGNATFSVTFPTACRSVTMNAIGSDIYAHLAQFANTSTARIRTNSATSANVNYIAIGY